MSIIPNINNQSIAILSDIEQWKEDIADAINSRGGVADVSESFQALAEDITQIPSTGIFSNGLGLDNTFSFLKYVTSYINNEIVSINDNTITEITRPYAFYKNTALREVVMSGVTVIRSDYCFDGCASLQSINLENLTSISAVNCFYDCSSLQSINLENLTTLISSSCFGRCASLQSINLKNLTILKDQYGFSGLESLRELQFGTLIEILNEPFYTSMKTLRNITIGQHTNINLPFHKWTATNVIQGGQSGIDELNSNLYNNLLTKLYDHSEDGQTRTLRLGWLAHVTQENINYANSKGWTLTT